MEPMGRVLGIAVYRVSGFVADVGRHKLRYMVVNPRPPKP